MQVSEVRHSQREGNNAAHVLAKLALNNYFDKIWLEKCPSSIQSIVLAKQVSVQ